ncbi:hypothetical protein GGF32_005971 [Allomyces javanicus]|nr:hypothetical protein GGF32_005971 [Allomyces javanicus]
MATPKDRHPCSGIEACKLVYLKFSCKDESATLEFYQTLGMTLEGRFHFGRHHSVIRFSYRTSNVEFNENSVALLFESRKIPGFESDGTNTKSTHAPRSASPVKPAAGAPPAPPARTISVPPLDPLNASDPHADDAEPALFNRNCPRDYLVIYVHFLPRVVKRLLSKGFKPLLDIQGVMDIQYAIFLDPNGMEVRLMELPDLQLNEVTNKVQWFARLGYYLAHVGNGDDMRHYFESLFSKQRKTQNMLRALQQQQQQQGGPDDSVGNRALYTPSSAGTGAFGFGGLVTAATSAATALRKRSSGGATSTTDRFYQRTGVRLVDAEDIATGLQQTKYLWLGHLPREKMCCLCLCERTGGDQHRALARAGTASVTIKRSHRLVAVGIEIGVSLDAAIAQLIKEAPESVSFYDERLRVHEYGNVVRARGLHDFQFELCTTIDSPTPTDPKLAAASLGRRSLVGGFPVAPPIPPAVESTKATAAAAKSGRTDPASANGGYYINYNQKLRTVMSETALCQYRQWSDSDQGGAAGTEGLGRPGGGGGVSTADASRGASVRGSATGTRTKRSTKLFSATAKRRNSF